MSRPHAVCQRSGRILSELTLVGIEVKLWAEGTRIGLQERGVACCFTVAGACFLLVVFVLLVFFSFLFNVMFSCCLVLLIFSRMLSRVQANTVWGVLC